MQVSYGLYWRFLVALAYLKESVEHEFLVISFMQKKRHLQPSVKKWRIIRHMASEQQFLPEKMIKIQFNFVQWFIDWMPNQTHCQKNFADRFRLATTAQGRPAQLLNTVALGF